MVGLFDVDGGDVVREEHDLVGMEFVGVFPRGRSSGADQAGLEELGPMNVPVPVEGSRMWTSSSPRPWPNSRRRTSSADLMMKSTTSTGV